MTFLRRGTLGLFLIFAGTSVALAQPVIAEGQFTQPLGEAVVAEPTSPYAVQPWASVQTTTGPGIGYQTSYSSLQGFVPLVQGPGGLLFADLRGNLANSWLLSSNAGLGYRYFNPTNSRIAGANLYYDFRDVGINQFNQTGFGFESLGRYFDFRTNAYLPVGTREQFANNVGFFNPAFISHFLQLDRVDWYQGAMSGFDTEVGGPLPYLSRWGFKGYLGTYDYQVSNSPQAWGAKGRLEARLTDSLNLNLTLANDHVFGTSVIFNAGFRFGGRASRAGSSRGVMEARMADPVERNANIVVTNVAVRNKVLATDAAGHPLDFIHVASYAAAGGDGTFEHPFQTLTQAQGGSVPNDIIFAWANSVFAGQSITLQNGQRFLGEGLAYTVTSAQGTFLLPRATSFTSAPVISGSTANAITLASNNEVSNFVITGAGANGIIGTGITSFNIHNNTITAAAVNGILLTNAGGTGTIASNTITNNGIGSNATNTSNGGVAVANAGAGSGSGIVISASNFSGAIFGNVITGNGTGGNAVANANNTAGNGGVAVANAGAGSGNGILITNGTSFNGVITGNTITSNGAAGTATASANGTGNGGVAVANGATGSGSGIQINGSTVLGSISGNTISGNGSGSVTSASAIGAGNGGVAVANGGSGGGNGIWITNASTVTASIGSNAIMANGTGGAATSNASGTGGNGGVAVANGASGGTNGIRIDAGNTLNGSITGNTIASNGTGGTAAATATGAGGIAVGNGGSGAGFGVSNAGTINGSITGNAITGNGNGGAATATATIPVANNGAGNGNGTGINNTGTITGTISGNTGAGTNGQ